jgi:enoyl-CoA hydratase
MAGSVILEREGTVATVVLSNPAKKNALNLKLLSELRDAFADLQGEDVRCVVLRG